MPFANFQVDPRLATLLGESYRSTEQAIKELVDNAWDADAQHVLIRLPKPMTTEPIPVVDDGSGMSKARFGRSSSALPEIVARPREIGRQPAPLG